MTDASTANPVDAVRWQASTLTVPGADGPLALHQCVPVQGTAVAQVVLAAAIGVPQQFYVAFVQWLAAQGYAVTTFDYRSHGQSLHGPLKSAHANLLDWGADCAAVAQSVRQQAPAIPLYWIGHSVGAQLPGTSSTPLPIDGLLSIASGSGYWRDNAPPTRRKVLLWWQVIAPIITTLFGCLPGKKWGMVGDLPAGVVWQWRRWCMHPNYGIGVEGAVLREAYAAARYPLHALAVDDDEMMSARSVAGLLGWYRNCPQTLETLSAQDVPQRRIGHFGFFRASMQKHLWPHALAVLQGWHSKPVVTPAGHAKTVDAATVHAWSRASTSPSDAVRAGRGDVLSETP